MLSMRYLNAITLTIKAGDCVVVQHNDPQRASVLLGALAGDPLVLNSPGLCGSRATFPGLRIRRASVHAEVLDHILKGWREGLETRSGVMREAAPASAALPIPDLPPVPMRAVAERPAKAPVVHLLRLTRKTNQASTIPPLLSSQWRKWAAAEAGLLHAVVLLVHRSSTSDAPLGSEVGTKPLQTQLNFVDGQFNTPRE